MFQKTPTKILGVDERTLKYYIKAMQEGEKESLVHSPREGKRATKEGSVKLLSDATTCKKHLMKNLLPSSNAKKI